VEGFGGYPKNTGAKIRVRTISDTNPTHQAPTQRGSFCCSVILQHKQSTHCWNDKKVYQPVMLTTYYQEQDREVVPLSV